jgi:hypothetical protein
MKYWEWANRYHIPNNERVAKDEWFTLEFWEKWSKYDSEN